MAAISRTSAKQMGFFLTAGNARARSACPPSGAVNVVIVSLPAVIPGSFPFWWLSTHSTTGRLAQRFALQYLAAETLRPSIRSAWTGSSGRLARLIPNARGS